MPRKPDPNERRAPKSKPKRGELPQKAKNKTASSPQRALKRLNKERGKGWVYDPKTRGAFNKETGEKISRRQLDKNYGLLKEQSLVSYEKKAIKRKKNSLAGFKSVPLYPTVLEKNFKTYEQMMTALIDLSGNDDYVFRVKATGEPADIEKYRIDDSGESTFYTFAPVAMTAEDLFDFYERKDTEKKFKKISKYTLVAMPNQHKK